MMYSLKNYTWYCRQIYVGYYMAVSNVLFVFLYITVSHHVMVFQERFLSPVFLSEKSYST